jgi:hypothetical protein
MENYTLFMTLSDGTEVWLHNERIKPVFIRKPGSPFRVGYAAKNQPWPERRKCI